MALLLKDLIPRIVESHDDWRLSLLKEWPTIVGSLATRVRLEKVTQDMIIVGVYESHWMQELYLLSPVLIDSVNKFLGNPYIKQVRFKLVEDKPLISPWRAREKSHHVNPPKPTFNGAQQKALENISDPQLREALMGFWGKCQAFSLLKK